MIEVFFESNSHAELVANFVDEETYNACLPALKEMAEESRMTVTESVKEE